MDTDCMKITMEHFQAMCLNDPVMQALYRNELSWADASEDMTPLELDGWREYLVKGQQPPTVNAWSKPLRLTGSKRAITPPESPVKKKERVLLKKVPVISDEDQGKQTLFIRDIPKDVSNEEILKQIEPLGRVKHLHRSTERCFAMVRMQTVEEAQHVYLSKMNEFILKGKPRKISFAMCF